MTPFASLESLWGYPNQLTTTSRSSRRVQLPANPGLFFCLARRCGTERGRAFRITPPGRTIIRDSEGGIPERSKQSNPDLLKACQGFAGGLREDQNLSCRAPVHVDEHGLRRFSVAQKSFAAGARNE